MIDNHFERLADARRQLHWAGSPVRCWPHHFDIATLIPLDAEPSHAETARSIGAGLSLGDAKRPLPYLYVTPWPYPFTEKLPDLEGGGTWNTEGWVGAVLDAATLQDGAGDPERFLESAVAGCRALLGE